MGQFFSIDIVYKDQTVEKSLVNAVWSSYLVPEKHFS